MKDSSRKHISAALTIIGFTLMWPAVLLSFVPLVVAIADGRTWSIATILSQLSRTSGEIWWPLTLIGLAEGALLALAGARLGKPPVWIILPVAAVASLAPWLIFRSRFDESEFWPAVALYGGLAIGIGSLIWGLLTRLIWKAKPR